MPIEDKVALTSRLLQAGGSLVALSLPTAALINLEALPDDLSRFAYVVFPAVSLALVVTIFISGASIGALSSKRAAALTLGLALAGATVTLGYTWISDKLVISLVVAETGGGERTEILVKPLFPSPRIRAIIDEYEGDYVDALTDHGPHVTSLKRYMYRDSGGATIALLGTLLLAQLLFVAAIVGGAWWLAERNHGPAPLDDEP